MIKTGLQWRGGHNRNWSRYPPGSLFSESWQGILAGRSGIATQEAERPGGLQARSLSWTFPLFCLPGMCGRLMLSYYMHLQLHVWHCMTLTFCMKRRKLSLRKLSAGLARAGPEFHRSKKQGKRFMTRKNSPFSYAVNNALYGPGNDCPAVWHPGRMPRHFYSMCIRSSCHRRSIPSDPAWCDRNCPCRRLKHHLCEVCFEAMASRSTDAGDNCRRQPPFRPWKKRIRCLQKAPACGSGELSFRKEAQSPVYAEIAGYVNRNDGHHLTQPYLPSQITVLNDALRMAGLGPDQIDHINAHGTSTQNRRPHRSGSDQNRLRRTPLPVGALKSMTGHMLAASAAFEIACTAISVRDGVIPPTINVTSQDRDCPLTLTPETISMRS